MPPVAQASLKPEMNSTTHVHQIYIKAEPGQIWDAITSPEWNGQIRLPRRQPLRAQAGWQIQVHRQ